MKSPGSNHLEERTLVSREIIRGAVHQWDLRGDPAWIEKLLTDQRLLKINAEEIALLETLSNAIREGLAYPDYERRLVADGDPTADFLLKVKDQGDILTVSTWEHLWSKLRGPILAQKLQSEATLLGDSAFPIKESQARIFALFEEEITKSQVEEDLFKVEITNNPEKEPKIEPPPCWIEGLLYPGYSTVSGPWKGGKTWLTLGASIAIAAGVPFLGRPTKQGRPAWLQLDMPTWSFVDYCRLLRAGMSLPIVDVPFFGDGRIDLKLPEHQRRLAQALENLQTEILFIDSGRAASSVEENNSDEVLTVTRKFICAQVRDRLGISVVLINHAAKGIQGGSRGSGEWDAAADSCLKLSKDEDTITLKGSGRHPPVEMVFTIDDLTKNGGGVAIRELDKEEWREANREKVRKTSGPSRVENFLRAADPENWHSIRAIKESAGVGHRAIPGELQRLRDRGLIESRPCSNNRGEEWRWCLECRVENVQ
jgi:hypothetical protein